MHKMDVFGKSTILIMWFHNVCNGNNKTLNFMYTTTVVRLEHFPQWEKEKVLTIPMIK